MHIMIDDVIQNFSSDPKINISTLSEQFESDGVTVTLGSTGENDLLIAYNITVVPQVPVIHIDNYFQLRVPYNTLLNVSISATVMCGESSTSYIDLYYSKCMFLHL